MKRLAYVAAAVALFAASLFFVVIIAYVASAEVLPALENGSLNVDSTTMILNVLWEGNEIYVLLAAYALLAASLAWGAYRFLRLALRN